MGKRIAEKRIGYLTQGSLPSSRLVIFSQIFICISRKTARKEREISSIVSALSHCVSLFDPLNFFRLFSCWTLDKFIFLVLNKSTLIHRRIRIITAKRFDGRLLGNAQADSFVLLLFLVSRLGSRQHQTLLDTFFVLLFCFLTITKTRAAPGLKTFSSAGAKLDNNKSNWRVATKQQHEFKFFADGQVISFGQGKTCFILKAAVSAIYIKSRVVSLFSCLHSPAGLLFFNRPSYTAHILLLYGTYTQTHLLQSRIRSCASVIFSKLFFFFLFSLLFKWQ